MKILRSGITGGAIAPGVYYEEAFEPDAPPQFRTGVPAFVGCCSDGTELPDRGLFSVSRWQQFESHFPWSSESGYLGAAVRGFFENGGQRCVVVAVKERGDLVEALSEPFAQGGALEDVEEVDLVCVPDAMLPVLRNNARDVQTIQSAALEHCRRSRQRFAILDGLPIGNQDRSGPVTDQWESLPPREGALYFPWVSVSAPERTRRMARPPVGVRLVPPCGHVAGVYARVDAAYGAHKAPANEILEGVVDLEVALDDAEQANLNDKGVNCLRSFTGRGIRVWGARTLSGQRSWRYVNVTRLFLTLTRWMTHRLDDLVFEPHTPRLWDSVRERLSSYCVGLFQQGALKGATAEQAFFVKCDAETNPFEIRESGAIIAEIGLAPVAPAEFIVVHVTLRATGATFTPSTEM